MMIDFEMLPHTADIKIRAYGATKKELFCNALIGMFQSVQPITDTCRIENDRVVCDVLPATHHVTLKSADEESLLIDFLSEALYLSDVYDEAYFDADIAELTETMIKATLRGVHITGFAVVEIKAVTYHELVIQQHDGVWQVDIVFDI
jgi:SHS2 domain-containing protein